MNADINIYGVMVPPLFVLALAGLAIHAVIRHVLSKIGFYRLVWHRPLFDTALFICLLAGTTLFINRVPL